DRARAAVLIAAFYPAFVCFVLTTPYYYYLYTAAVCGTAYFWLRSLREHGWIRDAALSGLAAGVGSLSKAVLLVAPAQALAVWISGQRPFRGGRLSAWFAAFLLVFSLVLAPWVLRNYRVFGAFVPVCTSGGPVLLSANNPDSNGLFTSLPGEADVDTPEEMLSFSRESTRQALAFMKSQPGCFARLVALKILHTWGNETTFTEQINVRGEPNRLLDMGLSFLFQTAWCLLVMCWAVASFRAFRLGREASPLELVVAVVVVANALVYMVFEGGARHHLPLVPLLVPCVMAMGLDTAARRPDAGDNRGIRVEDR
ncbi:MAG: hypothetical protein JXQ75_09900, partial [Phycisphaerae bacterium]|nr:hypothetical protein [Phycisphaerae bacterium]